MTESLEEAPDLGLYTPYEEWDTDPLPYREAVEDTPGFTLAAARFGEMPKLAPASSDDAAHFNREQHAMDSRAWLRKCLALQRTARKCPAVFPTALSAAIATPKEERVEDKKDLRRGMVGYSYDPKIPGTAGHVFLIVGRLDGSIITASNDVKTPGGVDYVSLDFYENVWGHTFQFGATWINGYDFSDFNKPVQVTKGSLGAHYKAMIDDLKGIRARKREKLGAKHALVLALSNDIERMTKHYDAWKAAA